MTGDFGLQLRAALVGDFDKEVQKAQNRDAGAKAAAVFDFTDETASKLHQDFEQSGLKRAHDLSKTWHARHYRNKGDDPAGLVYSSMPLVVQAFESGATIKSEHGLYIVVPNPEVWPTGRVAHRRRGGAQSTVALGEARFGKLSFVYRPGPVSFLVAEVRASNSVAGAFRKASSRQTRTGSGLVSIVVFFLMKEAHLKHRLHGNVIRSRARAEMQPRIQQLYVRHLNEDRDTPALLTGPSS